MNKTICCICLALIIFGCKKKETSTPAPVDYRDEMTGNYIVSDTLRRSGNPDDIISYVLVVGKDASKDGLILGNLLNEGKDYNAILAGKFFSVPSQNNLMGSGRVENGIITYELSISGGKCIGRGEK